MNWQNLSYLCSGTTRQQAAYRVLNELAIFDVLKDFDPVLVGTIPIQVDIEGSDLDIIHQAHDLQGFADIVREYYGSQQYFRDRFRVIQQQETYIANFYMDGFELELFAQDTPVTQQNAYIHMVVEYRLLQIGGESAQGAIRGLKRKGLKTEPAFARYFGINNGDPYQRLLDLAKLDDLALQISILSRGSGYEEKPTCL